MTFERPSNHFLRLSHPGLAVRIARMWALLKASKNRSGTRHFGARVGRPTRRPHLQLATLGIEGHVQTIGPLQALRWVGN